MAGQDDLRSRRIKCLPEHPRRLVVVVFAETEAGMVPVGQGAFRRMGFEVLAQPLFLRRSGMTAARLRAVGVEDHDVPGAQVVAVVPLLGVPPRRIEVAEVASCPAGQILVIADSW